ncbi:hypothetical protein ISN45_Aa04g025760 [Arabidopsis thaliana x Arabidopsis arenosa]|uniref:Uncharacterized protein n=2 Tax=Arabidopsis TaxID=3701 RepID=A0A8T2AJA6_ARASU|nr:hypothetical protein ISN45_Aa04g025760 [Arabidopsis thaliana x Arabidopsis arenosa]KAG7574372.1 hypothetical protein ISN44_As09g025610 [Arabidopsis suecica]
MKTMSERSEDDTNGVRSSKIIVKESSQVNSSSRIYYYGGASVPFLWETQPGTPKHSLFSESFRVPPLTPPPSYYSSSPSSGNKLSKARTKQTRFVKTLLSRHVSRPSFSWSSTSSSSSSSYSSSSPPSKAEHRPRKCYSCSRSYVKEDDEEEIRSSSPTSTLCYKRGFSSSMGSMKRALCSVLSHGSSRKDLRLM